METISEQELIDRNIVRGLMFDCVRKAVSKPSDILHSFRAADKAEPILNKLTSYLRSVRQRLMTIPNRVKNLHADATYKLIHEGYPVLLVGITDMNKAFHPCGFAITPSESKEDFKYLFTSLKKGVEQIIDGVYKPTYLVAGRGFEITFGPDFKRVFCYF